MVRRVLNTMRRDYARTLAYTVNQKMQSKAAFWKFHSIARELRKIYCILTDYNMILHAALDFVLHILFENYLQI